VLGRNLERVDMTCRLLKARSIGVWGDQGWVTTLRCCSAHEAYLRTYQRAVDASLAGEFLLLDRLFPRSVFCALNTAERCLAELDPRSGGPGSPTRPAGQSDAPAPPSSSPRFRRSSTTCPSAWPSSRSAAARRRPPSPVATSATPAPSSGAPDGPLGMAAADPALNPLRYDGEVTASYNEVRLSPMTTGRQVTLDARVEVQPATRMSRHHDYWGTLVYSFDLHQPHTELQVVGRSVVETSGAPNPGPRSTGRAWTA